MITYEQYQQEFKELGHLMARMVRGAGRLELQHRGSEEIGSSDISCCVFELYKRYNGSFDEVVKHGLRLMHEA